MTAADRFFEIANSKDRVDEAAVAAVYDQLDALPSEGLIGSWKGTSLDTGHPAHQRLLDVNWAGKDFHSVDDVNPVILFDEQGKRVVSQDFGKARIRQVIFRGVATASMVYDIHPIIDSFRRVSDDVVLGAMDSREFNAHGTYYFYLTRNRD